MKPEKMTIKVEGPTLNSFDSNPPIHVMFNPNQFTINRTIHWPTAATASSHSETQHTHPDPATLDIAFLFDVFEENGNLLDKISAIVDLSKTAPHLHQPPACRLLWGEWHIFQGVLTSLRQNFTLFLDTGMPARATLTCSFKARVEGDENFSADVAKTHVVRRGDRISGIARAQYSDASLWRPIADANRIKDPLRLPVGRTLLIPSLTPSTRSR